MRLPKGTKLNKMECGVIWAKRYVYHMANIINNHKRIFGVNTE